MTVFTPPSMPMLPGAVAWRQRRPPLSARASRSGVGVHPVADGDDVVGLRRVVKQIVPMSRLPPSDLTAPSQPPPWRLPATIVLRMTARLAGSAGRSARSRTRRRRCRRRTARSCARSSRWQTQLAVGVVVDAAAADPGDVAGDGRVLDDAVAVADRVDAAAEAGVVARPEAGEVVGEQRAADDEGRVGGVGEPAAVLRLVA